MKKKLLAFILVASFINHSAYSNQINYTNNPALPSLNEEWQLKIQEKIRKETAQSMQPSVKDGYFSEERIHDMRERMRSLVVNDGAFQRHQISKFCQPEIKKYCSTVSLTSPDIRECLLANLANVGSQCRTVVRDRFEGPPTKVDAYLHEVFIPAGSQYYFIPTNRSLGVKLSRTSNYKGVPITGDITWFDGGQIRSYVPFNTAVRYDPFVFSPNEAVYFFPDGSLKQGVLYQPVNIDHQLFQAGALITRETNQSTWR